MKLLPWLACWSLIACSSTPARLLGVRPTLPVRTNAASLDLFTLNIAHGSGLAVHASVVEMDEFEPNLRTIGRLLARERPDIAALQEVDVYSTAGRQHQLPIIAQESGLTQGFLGPHTRVSLFGATLHYGNAVLSHLPITYSEAHNFRDLHGESGDPQGFVLTEIHVPAWGRHVDVISVHLMPGFSWELRRREIDAMAAVLRGRQNLRIVMGDLNAEWHPEPHPEEEVAYVARALGVVAYEPLVVDRHDSFGAEAPSARLDWILVSPPLEIETYVTLPDLVSDHRAVVARVRLPTDQIGKQMPAKQGPTVQVPQEPPQPSSPQTAVPQAGVQGPLDSH